MKILDYSVYGDNKQYCDFRFETENDYIVAITFYDDGTHNVECNGVTFEELEQAKKMSETLLKTMKELEE